MFYLIVIGNIDIILKLFCKLPTKRDSVKCCCYSTVNNNLLSSFKRLMMNRTVFWAYWPCSVSGATARRGAPQRSDTVSMEMFFLKCIKNVFTR